MPSQAQGPRPDLSAAALFRRLWDALVELVGTPAAAALLRRAVKRAAARSPATALPEVTRERLDYAVRLPPAWEDAASPDALRELQRLVREDLEPLFRELTGPVIAARLARIPELLAAHVVEEGPQ